MLRNVVYVGACAGDQSTDGQPHSSDDDNECSSERQDVGDHVEPWEVVHMCISMSDPDTYLIAYTPPDVDYAELLS